MKTLIVEDDFTSRFLLQTILSTYGECRTAVNGLEALEAYQEAKKEREPFDLICLDIMMPEMDGQEVLKRIRAIEEAEGLRPKEVKIIMTTAMSDSQSIIQALCSLCNAYLLKPINKAKLLDHLQSFGLI
jgi:two-component system, chemotaxis family, chemotaxis protein CheY